MNLPEWLKINFLVNGEYADDRFGDLARNMISIIKTNPLEEDFDDYETLEDWLEHLEMHVAPEEVVITMREVWELYAKDQIHEAE